MYYIHVMDSAGILYRYYKNTVAHRFDWLRGTYRLERLILRLAESSIKSVPKSKTESMFSRANSMDNFIILDACRFDLYKNIVGCHKYRCSLESNTYGYVRENYSQGDFSDTVYVTGNPHFSPEIFHEITGRYPSDVFHEVYHTYDTDWSDEKSTCLPKALIRDAKSARRLFPEKKLVIHFMQPHYPFVESELDNKGHTPSLSDSETSVWEDVMLGEVSHEQAIAGYEANLEFIIEQITDFIENLEGRTVVTSDHGNYTGENGLYGHPEGYRAEALRKVPWDVR